MKRAPVYIEGASFQLLSQWACLFLRVPPCWGWFSGKPNMPHNYGGRTKMICRHMAKFSRSATSLQRFSRPRPTSRKKVPTWDDRWGLLMVIWGPDFLTNPHIPSGSWRWEGLGLLLSFWRSPLSTSMIQGHRYCPLSLGPISVCLEG